jgi:dihydrolipoamide dehydrogenase
VRAARGSTRAERRSGREGQARWHLPAPSAASRPRRCLHAAEVADSAREASPVRRAGQPGRHRHGRPSTSTRTASSPGSTRVCSGLVKSRGITDVEGAGSSRRPDARSPGERVLTGTQSRAGHGFLLAHPPGLVRRRVLTSDQALQSGPRPRVRDRPRRRRDRCRVRQRLAVVRRRGHHRRGPAPAGPAEDEASPRPWSAPSASAGSSFRTSTRFDRGVTQDEPGSPSASRTGDATAEVLLVAVGRGPVDRGLGFEESGWSRSTAASCRGPTIASTNVPPRVCRRRHRAGPAAGAPRLRPGHLRRRGDRRAAPEPVLDRASPVTYCDPEIASVGSPRRRPAPATATASDYEYNLGGNGKSQILGTQGFVKLVERPTAGRRYPYDR